MKQDIYETRQRAKDILEEAIKIWRNTPQSDYLEGIEEDPIFSLLTMVLAHQLNRLDLDLKFAKEEVVRDFVYSLVPDSLLTAFPASLVVSCMPIPKIDKIEMNENMAFSVNKLPTYFRPILRSTVYNLQVKSIRRRDGLTWNVAFTSPMPISNLSRFAFAITHADFDDLNVSLNGKPLPLIKPWNSYNLPFSSMFSTQTMVYNGKIENKAQTICYELFNKHNQRIFIIDKYDGEDSGSPRSNEISLDFQFYNVSSTFVFNANSLVLNPVVLANVDIETASLSKTNPIVRISGINYQEKDYSISKYFMYLLSPQDDQAFESSRLTVRSTWSERYTALKLSMMIQQLNDKLNTDFYAFHSLNNQEGMALLRKLTLMLKNLKAILSNNAKDESQGVYLKFLPDSKSEYSSMSATIDYLSTAGATINSYISGPFKITPPEYLDSSSIKIIGKPVLGKNPVETRNEKLTAAKYYFLTHDRIVTPADIKSYCRMELISNHGLGDFMINDIKIEHRRQKDWRQAPYEIFIKILLNDNKFLKTNFVNKIVQVEQEFAKTIESKSVNIYPIKVEIEIIKE